MTQVDLQVPKGDELVPLVDKHDFVVGAKLRSALETSDRTRVVNAFIQSPNGKIWIPVRGPERNRFPGKVDFSIAGVVRFGETYSEALAREAEEDLGFATTSHPTQLVAQLLPKDAVSCPMHIFLVRAAQTPTPKTGLYQESGWKTVNEISGMLKPRDKAKPDFVTVFTILKTMLEA